MKNSPIMSSHIFPVSGTEDIPYGKTGWELKKKMEIHIIKINMETGPNSDMIIKKIWTMRS